MDRLGMSEEDLRQALNLILERRRVSQDLLKAHFGSSARATNMLSILEINGFVDKPEGSTRWEIDFNAIQSYLAGNISTKSKISANKGPKTIKNLGLQQMLDIYDFSNRRLNLAKILTADLSIEEIISSLEIIQRKYEELDEFNRIYPQLEDKIQKFEENCKELEEEQQGLEQRLDQVGGTMIAIMVSYIFLSIIIGFVIFPKSHPPMPIMGIYAGFILVGAIFIISKISKSDSKEKMNLQNEKISLEKKLQELSRNKKQVEQERESLIKRSGLENARWGANSISAQSYENKLRELEELLLKMKIILTDDRETVSGQLIQLEKFLYFVNKKYTDEEMLAEQQRATDYARQQADRAQEQLRETQRQVQAMKNLENAVNLQTEYQIWQDLGSEAGKATVAHRLYKDN